MLFRRRKFEENLQLKKQQRIQHKFLFRNYYRLTPAVKNNEFYNISPVREDYIPARLELVDKLRSFPEDCKKDFWEDMKDFRRYLGERGERDKIEKLNLILWLYLHEVLEGRSPN